MFRLVAKVTVTDEEYDLLTAQEMWGHVIMPRQEFNIKGDTTLKELVEGHTYFADDLPHLARIEHGLEARLEQLKDYVFGSSGVFQRL